MEFIVGAGFIYSIDVPEIVSEVLVLATFISDCPKAMLSTVTTIFIINIIKFKECHKILKKIFKSAQSGEYSANGLRSHSINPIKPPQKFTI